MRYRDDDRFPTLEAAPLENSVASIFVAMGGCPRGLGCAVMQMSPVVSQHDPDEQHPEGRCGHGEELEGDEIREAAADYCP